MRFVLFPEEGVWVIMCLEKYIGSQANTPAEAIQALKCVYQAEYEYNNIHKIPTSPQRYWDMFNNPDSNVIKGRIKRET